MAITLAVMLVFSAVAVGYAAPKWGMPPGQEKKLDNMARFDDLKGFEWAEDYINTLAGAGLLKGYGNAKFQPNRSVSNVEAVVMVLRMMGYDQEDAEESDYEFESGFNQNNIPAWAWAHVRLAYELGILEGAHFNPNAAVKREAVATMIVNGMEDENLAEAFMNRAWLDFADADDVDDDKVGQVHLMKRYGLMTGDEQNRFNPQSSLRRAEMAKVMYQYMKKDWEGSEYPSATVYLNDEMARDNVAVKDFEIKVVFSEDVFDEEGNAFTTGDILDIVTLTDNLTDPEDEDYIDLKIEDPENDEWIFTVEGELDRNTTYVFEIMDDSVYDSDGDEGYELRGQTTVEFTTVDERLRAWLDPEDGTTGVETDAEIAIEFSEEPYMEDGDDFVAYTEDEAEKMVKITFEDLDEEEVEVEFELDLDGDRWILDFEKGLNTTYTVKLGIGNPVGDLYTADEYDFTGDHIYKFSTIGNYVLDFEVETFMDDDSELVDATQETVVTINFGKDILDADGEDFDSDNLDDLVIIEPDDFDMLATLEWEFEGDDTVVLTVEHLDFDTEYTVTVDEDMLFGGIEGDNSVTFETREEPEISGEYTSPSTVVFTFDGPIVDEDGNSLEAGEYEVVVYEDATDSDPLSADDYDLDFDEGELTVEFNEDALADGEDYIIELSGFYYNDDEEYEEDFEFEFEADVE